MQFTNEQLAIFDAVKNSTQNVAVKATAGAGKTTTILECLRYVDPNEKTTFLSFSNAIVKELTTRVPGHIKAQTLHSRGFAYLRNYDPRIKDFKLDENKYFSYAVAKLKAIREDIALTKKDFRLAFIIQSMCEFARNTLTNYSDKQAMEEMCQHFNIDYDEESLKISMELLEKNAKVVRSLIDFVDMVYLPAVTPEMVTLKYKNIFLDEAQDTNAAQLRLVESMISPKGGRLISVGDDYQCIYGFSGADVDAFKRIRERPDTITLPLSYTFRCPKSHVELAREVCPEINAPDFAKDGDHHSGTWEEIKEGDIVLSRITRPLIALYFLLIDRGTKATVVGKDFEKGLLNLLEDLVEDGQTLEGFKYAMDQKRVAMINELTADGVRQPKEHFKYVSLDERLQVLKLIMRKVTTPRALTAKVKEIFADNKKAVRLMTIHRAKGLENDRVFVIIKNNGEAMMPSKYAQKDWEHQQERNLIFVARTRSKADMIFIDLQDAA